MDEITLTEAQLDKCAEKLRERRGFSNDLSTHLFLREEVRRAIEVLMVVAEAVGEDE